MKTGLVVTWIGIAMVLLGVNAYIITQFASVTALIPAFVGVPVLLCGLASRKFGAAVAIAGVLGVLGLVGPLARLVPQATGGTLVFNAATIVQILFVLLAAALVVVVAMGMRPKKA